MKFAVILRKDFTLKVHDWRTWYTRMATVIFQEGKKEIGAGVYCPLADSKNCVEPNGTGVPIPYVKLK
eukprot:375064-Pelagomonas_calceolata.AAC.1